jgi:cell wall-associated NlpC family hydrolase
VVSARQSHLYPEEGMKVPPFCRLPFGARLQVIGLEGRWALTPRGLVHRSHIRKLEEHETDPVEVAERFLGTPYLWAGNTGDGIDCSGLVQAAFLACGIDCPGDSDLQAARLGAEVAPDAPVRRGDLFFWKGHVAMARDPETLIHANAYRMAVTHEPLEQAVDRIAAQGDGPVTLRRRVPLG